MSDKPNGTLILRIQASTAGSCASGVSVGWIITQLETVGQIALADTNAAPLRLAQLPNLTLSKAVHPGDLVSIYADAPKDGSVTLQMWGQTTLQSAQSLICQGSFEFTPSDAAIAQPQPAPDAPAVQADPIPEPVEEDAELQDFNRDMIPALRDHLRTSFKETYADLLSQEELAALCETVSSTDVGGMLMDDSKAQLVITVGDRIIGSAMCASQHNITYVWGMYVQKAYQRVGLGQSLMEAMLQKLPEKGMVELTVLKDSEAAVKFFESLGFKGHRSGEIEFVPGKTLQAANMYANVKKLRG